MDNANTKTGETKRFRFMGLSISVALVEEIEARIGAMEATGDVDVSERLGVALGDIADLDARDHGAYSKEEAEAWNSLRCEAKAALRKLELR